MEQLRLSAYTHEIDYKITPDTCSICGKKIPLDIWFYRLYDNESYGYSSYHKKCVNRKLLSNKFVKTLSFGHELIECCIDRCTNKEEVKW